MLLQCLHQETKTSRDKYSIMKNTQNIWVRKRERRRPFWRYKLRDNEMWGCRLDFWAQIAVHFRCVVKRSFRLHVLTSWPILHLLRKISRWTQYGREIGISPKERCFWSALFSVPLELPCIPDTSVLNTAKMHALLLRKSNCPCRSWWLPCQRRLLLPF